MHSGEGSSSSGGEDKDRLRNVVPMTAYGAAMFLKLGRDLGHKSNGQTMEWLFQLARPSLMDDDESTDGDGSKMPPFPMSPRSWPQIEQ
ncbi:unnamed protein product [Musa textilis]